MIVLLKRTGILLFATVIILSCLIITIGTRRQIMADYKTNKIVVLDAGHGSPDGGAEGASGVKEKDLNLAIAKKIKLQLEAQQITVIMTCEDDKWLYNEDEGKVMGSKKRADLKAREKIMNNSGADMFVSIHINSFPKKQYRGAQVFYAPNGEVSKRLGEAIQRELVKMTLYSNKRVAKMAKDEIYLLRNAQIPAVLVECGFLSNPIEEQLLKTEDYQQALADSITKGILSYYNILVAQTKS